MNINVNNSNSILGHVASVMIRRASGNQSLYLGIDDLDVDMVNGARVNAVALRFILGIARGDASVQELRSAAATVSDFFTAEATLGQIARLLEESFWARLGLELQVEFNVVSTGHGIVDDAHKVKLLLTTKEVV